MLKLKNEKLEIYNQKRKNVSLIGSLKKEWRIVKYQKFLLFLILPGLAALIIFHYIPMYGVLLAFKEYSPIKGIMGSPWVGLRWINQIIIVPKVGEVIKNTLMFSILGLVTGFPAPIILAILFNELRAHRFKKIVQSVSYLPNFLSWVVVAGLVITMLSPRIGLYGFIADLLGIPKVFLMQKEVPWVIIVLVSSIWKGVGWGSVIYLAVMSGINPEYYDAAIVDGATRFQRVRFITIPFLYPIITLNIIFSATGLLSSNFDQIFNMMNPMVLDVSNVIDIYIYRTGLLEAQFEFSTAIGLVRTVISVLLLIGANQIAKRYSEYTLW
ncbi:MAG: sugar ABC transporter permease [Ruminiclostridium sp.]|nr:sugar ABC transporter permease [Ruminiclostridium sp.]